MSAHTAPTLSQRSLLSSGSLLRVTRVSQVEQDVGRLQKSLEQRRSEIPLSNLLTPPEGTAESRSDGDMATCFRRLSALETMCEDLRDTLQDRLGQFRGELEEKLKHSIPSNSETNEQNCGATIPLDATEQASPMVPGGDLSQTVASVHGVLRTQMTKEVGQLRSFIEREVQSLCRKLEVQSEKVQQNVAITVRSEATNNWLSQRMTEIGHDVAQLREMDIASGSQVSELRSRLEVVVRERDELTEEMGRWAAFLKQEKGLSERVQSLENSCQQTLAMPAVMLEAAESLRAELRQVVDPLRKDVSCLKQEFRNLAESPKDPERCSSPHEVASLHRRLSDLENAHADESRLMWRCVELLQREHVDVQDRVNKPTNSGARPCAGSIMKAEASLSNELAAMKTSNLATGAVATISPLAQPLVEGQLKEVITGHLGSRKAQSQVQQQVSMTVEANSTLSSESHPALVHATSPIDLKAQRTSVALHSNSGTPSSPGDVGKDGGTRKDHKTMHEHGSMHVLTKTTHAPQSLSPIDSKAAWTSVPLHTNSGISSSPQDVSRVLCWDGSTRKDYNTTHGCGSMRLPANATNARQSPGVHSRTLSFDSCPLAFNGLASLHSAKEVSQSQSPTAGYRSVRLPANATNARQSPGVYSRTLSLDLCPSAFDGLASLHSAREASQSQSPTAFSQVALGTASSTRSGTGSVVLRPRRK